MSKNYCITCRHEKSRHLNKKYMCICKDCTCKQFERGPELDVLGNEIK